MNFLSQLFSTITAPLRALLSSPLALFSAPKRLLGMSLPMRAAVLVFIFLLICTITAYVAFLVSPDRAGYEQWVSVTRIVMIVVLLIVIPVVVHRAMKLWLEGEVSNFPDIDYAWKEGVAALRESGLDLTDVPLYLVVGVCDEVQAKNLFRATQLSMRVQNVPAGPAALHWFANPDAIFLVVTQTSRLSKLAKLAKDAAGNAAAAGPMPAGRGGPAPAAALRGTIVAGDLQGSITTAAVAPAPAAPAVDIRGTMNVGGETFSAGRGASAMASVCLASLTTADANEQTARLQYVCQLLRRARQPLCPINGLLNVLPFDFIQRGSAEGIEVQRAVSADLDIIRRELKIRCPVTALVGGMETESGFRELIRRVGTERARLQRFGKGFNVWNPPIPEQVEAVALHACGAFEDWAYALFREKDGLEKPGNTKLYSLLCKIRSQLRTRLTNIMVDAFADDSEKDGGGGEGLLFAGCYFAAVGDSEDRQAFVKSVFEKMMEQENELDWTEAALAEDQRYQGMANVLMAVTGLLVVSLAGMIGYYWFFKKS